TQTGLVQPIASTAQLVVQGPFELPGFSPSERVKLIQLLAGLNQPPAKRLLEFLASKAFSLKELVDKGPTGLGLSAEDQTELIKRMEALKKHTYATIPKAVKLWNDRGAALADDALENSDGLEGLDLTPGPTLTPIFVPSRSAASEANDILQFRQQLNTVTIP